MGKAIVASLGFMAIVVAIPLAIVLATAQHESSKCAAPQMNLAALPQLQPGATSPLSQSGTRTFPIAADQYTLTQHFRGDAHRGVDLAATDGTQIYAAADGNVVDAGPASGFGQWIVVDSLDMAGTKFSTVYGHMWEHGLHVKTGDTVRAGQHIADVGNNADSSGPHLHFEVWQGGRTNGQAIDPEGWLTGAAAPTPDAPSTPGPLSTACPDGFGTPGGQLAAGTVPPELEMWYRQAGSLCPQISASLLAAQGKQESGFRRGLTSPDGAEGLAQFMPSTATSIDPLDGQPYVIDADHDGQASVREDGDAIIGQGRYMCALAAVIDRWKASGEVQGDTAALALGAYNAGEGAVHDSHGIPNQIPRHFTETQPYITAILSDEPNFRAAGASGEFVPNPSSPKGTQIVAASRQWLGTPYVWGGGGPQGPSNGGLDCSGLTSAAVFAATGISLPRTSEEQWTVGEEIPIDQVQPGDLLFGEWSGGRPGHVAIATGGGQMIHAPQTGEVVKEAPIQSGMKARRVS
ncbi:peptidoglycan DD-metalloendopeptidase family protein [Antrihabitans stalactiti]|jgi:cell wall-associated NlpC family hydrolase/biotin carboxyl carrier protein|uniref:Peptidase n=1 Tax=Antrihabitans stalactiti TaxID=2584121 RepID=A0A848KUX2_9NOCA|nr:peptidoglycan DD-metalloendopeptidase family protein [Antrihabitans stalactiti]NMN99307.1 peptidase [Antrihabitans stalactiti]